MYSAALANLTLTSTLTDAASEPKKSGSEPLHVGVESSAKPTVSEIPSQEPPIIIQCSSKKQDR